VLRYEVWYSGEMQLDDDFGKQKIKEEKKNTSHYGIWDGIRLTH
jgi:hypothetical protein